MLDGLFYNHIWLIPGVAYLFAVLFKAFTTFLKTNKLDLRVAFGSGGMPSVHSAIASSITTAIGLKHGVESDLFALSMTFVVVIIYDAINVRYEAGRHGKAINQITGKKEFKESLGHLPSEAFAGSIVGIIVALICVNFF